MLLALRLTPHHDVIHVSQLVLCPPAPCSFIPLVVEDKRGNTLHNLLYRQASILRPLNPCQCNFEMLATPLGGNNRGQYAELGAGCGV
jgi:hypothetical protein